MWCENSSLTPFPDSRISFNSVFICGKATKVYGETIAANRSVRVWFRKPSTTGGVYPGTYYVQ